MLARRGERKQDEVELEPVVDAPTLRRDAAGDRGGPRLARASASTWSTSSRRRATAPRIEVGASPRGSLALYKLARCRAALDGRDYVLPDDVKAIAAPALGHRLTLKPELWVQRVRPEDVVRGPARDACRRRRPRTGARAGANDALGVAAARRLRGVRVGGVPRRALSWAARRWPRSARRSPRSSCSRSSLAAHAASSTVALALDRRPDGRGRARSPASSSCVASAASHELELALVAPARPRARRRRRPESCCARAGERRDARSSCAPPWRWGAFRLGDVAVRARDRFGLFVARARSTAAHDAPRLPAAGAAALARSARSRRSPSPATGRPRRAARGSSSPTCGRSSPGDRVRRVNWRASARRGELYVNEHAPGAEQRRRPLPRQLRRGAARAREHARPRRARGRHRSRTSYLERSDRVGARRLRRRRALAPASTGIGQLYRDRSTRCSTPRSCLSYALEGRRRAAAAHAAAAGARGRAQPAARRAQHARAARPARPRLRPRRVDVSPLPFVDRRRPARSTTLAHPALAALRASALRFALPAARRARGRVAEGEPLAQRSRR